MPVRLQVSDVRRELWRAGGRADGDGSASMALLGRIFHDVFATLVNPESGASLAAALEDTESDLETWKRELPHHLWRLVGPRLATHRAVLHPATPQVVAFWIAVRELGDWLCELLWTVRRHDENGAAGLGGLEALVSPEQTLSWTLREPGWMDAVELSGIADGVLRLPGRAPWCVVELKLGRTSPAADLGQACLYHQMLAASHAEEGRGPAGGTLAVVSFVPARRERLLAAAELAAAQRELTALIGRLAGVLPDAAPRPVSVVSNTPSAAPAPEPPQHRAASPSQEHVELGRQLIRAFREYGTTVELDGDPIAGPTFVRFPLQLGRGVRLSAVQNRSPEIQVRLGLAAPPLTGLSEGRVVIDLQRPDRRYVNFSEVRGQLPDPDPLLGCSRVPVGLDLEGRLQFADFAEPEHAHLLVAGTTGSGKSEWLRAAIAGLLATNTPETLKLVLIDPKRNAFHALRDSAYLERPVVYPDERSAAETLEELADLMDDRYRAMDGADSLRDHVLRTEARVPRIVCVCDEYADLLSRGRDERKLLEEQIGRLGAKARAAGIHLVLATQRPSRDVVKGTLDANIPARVGLKTQSAIESRMLLGEPGAEHLLGHGDLLFKDIGEPRRLQSIYLPPEEREAAFRTGTPALAAHGAE